MPRSTRATPHATQAFPNDRSQPAAEAGDPDVSQDADPGDGGSGGSACSFSGCSSRSTPADRACALSTGPSSSPTSRTSGSTASAARDGPTEIEGYLLANRSLPWWAVGLSVMATQLSAVTMIGTTGQGATDGLRFIQFYFGLPLAMVILGVTLVPFLHGAKVFTAYEYLERRFDAKTRSLTAFLFLVSRGMSCGDDHRRARRGVLGDLRMAASRLVRGDHGRPDRHLHHARRRAGGDVGRREADGAHRRRRSRP